MNPHLCVPNDIEYTPAVLAFVEQIARKCGFNDTQTNKILVTVEEAVSNVLRHAFEAGEKASYTVECRPQTTGLEIAVGDRGLPFDPSFIAPYDTTASLQSRPEGGIGIFLMRKLMDKVSLRNLGTHGKETVLFKFYDSNHIEELSSAEELSEYARTPPTARPRSQRPFAVRLMEPAEAIEVSQCVYRAYGYSYVYENIYYPDRIVELNASGEMTSAVVVDQQEQTLAGHAALFVAPGTRDLMELGMAVVKPDYRGYGLCNQLFDFLLEQARQRTGLLGVFAHAVTNHPFTQRVCHHSGLVDCALQVGFAPSSLSFKGITDTLAQRESVVVCFVGLGNSPQATLYPPPQHREMIARIYAELALPFHFADPGPIPPASGPAEVSLHMSNSLGFAQIEVRGYGLNTLVEVSAMWRSLCLRHFEVIHLLLDLESPHTALMTAQFEELGFFFAGLLPGSMASHTLILQYLNNIVIDYDKIVLDSPLAQSLGAYLRRLDPSTGP